MNHFNFSDIERAYGRIEPYIYKTPLSESLYLGKGDRNYFFKLECNQEVRSFKLRGALSKMTTLSKDERARGVGTISSGNHGSAVSYAARLLGIPRADIVVPKNTPKAKVDRIEFYGGNVIFLGDTYDDAHDLGMAYISEQNLSFVDAYFDDPLVHAGQGTISMEILDQNPEIDTILVPVGGGGLINGIAVGAKALKPSVRVIGIQTEACPAMIRSFEDRVFYETFESAPSVCDAVIGGIGRLAYEMAEQYVDAFFTVSEESLKRATAFMILKEHHIVEPASAMVTAAVLDRREEIGGKNIALVLSGANIDSDLMTALINSFKV